MVGNEEEGIAGDPAGMTPLQQAERDYLAQYLVQRLVLEEGQQDANASREQRHINILPQTGKEREGGTGGGLSVKGRLFLFLLSIKKQKTCSCHLILFFTSLRHPHGPTGDTWDSLLTKRPKLLQPPAPIRGARLVSLQDFHKASAEITKLTSQTRRHSMGK